MRLWTLAALSAVIAIAKPSSGDYNVDLGQVYGGIRAAKMLEEVCSKDFPKTREPTQRAYQQWRKQYLPFIEEMEKHFSAAALPDGKNDPKQQAAILTTMEKSFDGQRDRLRQQLVSQGPDALRKTCETYPLFLQSPRMNLQSYFAEQVVTVRRGPKSN